MRIVHVNHRDIRHPKAGGLETLVHEISRRWVAQHHEVYLLCSGFSGSIPYEIIDGIHTFRIGREEYFNYIAGAWLLFHRFLDVDIVIEHLSKIPCGLPLFTRKRPFLAHCPHLFRNAIFEEVSWIPGSYVWIAELFIPLFYRNKPFWALSESTAHELQRIGLSRSNLEVIPGGIDLKSCDVTPTPHSNPTALYVGRIKKYKGIVEPLLTAWEKLVQTCPEAKLEIAGRGDYEPMLLREIQRRHLNASVRFHGYVSEAKKLELLKSAWFLVYPSAKEGWGLPVIEAGAAGIPTIASDSPGLRDSVQHQETGILVPHGDPSSLTRAMLEMIREDKARQRMGMNAKLWAKKFSCNGVAEKIMHWIQRNYPHLI